MIQQIINLRGKVIVNSDLRNLCDQISNLCETITKLATANQQINSELTIEINSELTIIKMVNSKLEKRVTDLEKKQGKSARLNLKLNLGSLQVFKNQLQ